MTAMQITITDLVFSPSRTWAFATSPTSASASWRSAGAARAPSPRASSFLEGKPGSNQRSSAAAFTGACPFSTRSTSCPSSPFPKGRSASSLPAMGSRSHGRRRLRRTSKRTTSRTPAPSSAAAGSEARSGRSFARERMRSSLMEGSFPGSFFCRSSSGRWSGRTAPGGRNRPRGPRTDRRRRRPRK